MSPGALHKGDYKGKLEQLTLLYFIVQVLLVIVWIYVFNFFFMPPYCVCVFCNFLFAKKKFQVAKGENYREYSEKTGFMVLKVVKPCESTRLEA